MSASFLIEDVRPAHAGHVEVHVRYEGGAMILTFPETYPQQTVLAQVRLEVKSRMLGESAKARLASLKGRHDL